MWYDLIPVFSWFLLHGSCRECYRPISRLYPFIELLTLVVMSVGAFTLEQQYWVAYFLFFSALIITVRTDLETMLISRYATLALVPAGWLLSTFGLLPITPISSIAGSLFGYGFLWLIRAAFKLATGKIGIGQGDLDLMAFIGAFVGILGCWVTISIGSLAGALLGAAYLIATRQSTVKPLPFGPFLALGAFIFVLAQHFFEHLFLGF
jgi:leader peptidase (prepilin peptidase)/N-methyltransferase